MSQPSSKELESIISGIERDLNSLHAALSSIDEETRRILDAGYIENELVVVREQIQRVRRLCGLTST